MQRKLLVLFLAIAAIATACHNKDTNQKNISNPGYSTLTATYSLKPTGEVKFPLDSISAPRITYTQLIKDSTGKECLSFFNKHNRSIYFYNYADQQLLQTIKIAPDQSDNEPIDPTGYYVDSNDTIYVYNRRHIELLKINRQGAILRKTSLIANSNIRQTPWYQKYPQYYPQGANPILKVGDRLVFPGQSFETMRDSLIHTFGFVSYIDTRSNDVQFYHNYPDSLYGNNCNWSGEKFTEAYIDWNPDLQKLIFSFPVSHQLYLAQLKDKSYTAVNGASNASASITSFPADVAHMDTKELVQHVLKTDEYGPIRYDPYRKVYYRFLRHGVKNYTSASKWDDKEVSVIILDKDFRYLGENNLGLLKNWYIQNAFVNQAGLHIEYISSALEEDYLTYKIFNIINL